MHDIDSRIEDASRKSLCHEHLGCNMRSSPSSYGNEPVSTAGSERVGRTRSRFEFCPRGGAPQIKTHTYSLMEMSQINKLTSGEFGTSGRHGDAVPGVARSSSDERNSCMDAACVHEENATAAVKETAPNQQQQEASSRRQEEDIPHCAKGKKKATTSPESNEDSVGIINTPRRPNKTRVVAAHELITTALSEERERATDMTNSDKEVEAEYKQLIDGRFLSSSPEKEIRITRSNKKKEEKGKISSAFDKLVTARMDKMMAKIDNLNKNINQSKTDKICKPAVRNSGTEDKAEDMASICSSSRIRTSERSSEFKKFKTKKGDSAVSSTEEINMSSGTYTSSVKNKKSLNKRKSKINKSYYESSEEDSNISGEENKKSNRNKSKIKPKVKSNIYKDITVKNPIRTTKDKRRVPEIISRDKVDLEIGYTREKWLKMSGAEFGAACLDHLAERQRYLCSNISGRIAGMLKDCGATAANIVGAMVEKLEATGGRRTSQNTKPPT